MAISLVLNLFLNHNSDTIKQYCSLIPNTEKFLKGKNITDKVQSLFQQMDEKLKPDMAFCGQILQKQK